MKFMHSWTVLWVSACSVTDPTFRLAVRLLSAAHLFFYISKVCRSSAMPNFFFVQVISNAILVSRLNNDLDTARHTPLPLQVQKI
jgi:hypothetical protein